MKNFNIYTEPKKNITYKLKKGTSKKLAAIGLSMVLATTSLTGCGNNNKTYSLTSSVEALSEKKGLTYIDEYLSISDIEKLDKEFINAYNKGNTKKCNETMEKICTIILKAQIAEGYNLNFADIKNFEVIADRGKVTNTDLPEHNESEYGVSFDYQGETYRFETIEGNSRKICVIERAGLQDQLVARENETDFDYFYLPNSYKVAEEALKQVLKYNNKEHVNKYDKGKGYEYDGYFKFKNDKSKAKTIKKYKNKKLVIFEDQSTKTTEKENNLPKKK